MFWSGEGLYDMLPGISFSLRWKKWLIISKSHKYGIQLYKEVYLQNQRQETCVRYDKCLSSNHNCITTAGDYWSVVTRKPRCTLTELCCGRPSTPHGSSNHQESQQNRCYNDPRCKPYAPQDQTPSYNQPRKPSCPWKNEDKLKLVYNPRYALNTSKKRP